jgi:DNA-directed RNA polymerase specialized sigma24 family protein
MAPEATFVARLRRREEGAFNELVVRCDTTLKAALVRWSADSGGSRLAGHNIDDLAAEVFVLAWRRVDELREESNDDPVPWLLQLAREIAFP